MSQVATTPTRRYITVSLRPETHHQLLVLLRPRETMDQLIRRLLDAYPPPPSP